MGVITIMKVMWSICFLFLFYSVLAQNLNSNSEYLNEAKTCFKNGDLNSAEFYYKRYKDCSQKQDTIFENMLKQAITQRIENDISYRNSKGIYRVGDYYDVNGKKGIVFYVDNTGKHGKIISMKTTNRQWSIINTNTGATDMNDGGKNMLIIQRIPNWERLFPAFNYCYNCLGPEWYLPAYNELKQIYYNKTVLKTALKHYGGDDRLYDTHFSSSELSTTEAWMIMTQFDEIPEIEEVNGNVFDLRGYSKQGDDGWIRAISTF